VLDAVVPHGAWLGARLNAADRIKVDQLFTGIRALEQELTNKPPPVGTTCMRPAAPATGLDFAKQLDYLHNLMAIAFQCDVTRVITFMMGDALNNRNLAFIPTVAETGGEAGDHAVSHHSGDAALVSKFRAMVLWKMEQIAAFLRKLKTLQDADGQALLANTLVMISSELADGNRHNHDNKPILLAGQLGGLVTTDRHVAFPGAGRGGDYSNVKTWGDFFITLMGLYDVKVTAFGDDGMEAIAWNR
jgi:hypothetical protein